MSNINKIFFDYIIFLLAQKLDYRGEVSQYIHISPEHVWVNDYLVSTSVQNNTDCCVTTRMHGWANM